MSESEEREQDRHDRRIARLAKETDIRNSMLAALEKVLDIETGNDPESQSHPESPYHFVYAAIAKAKGTL